MCGKWHLGSTPDNWPSARGFDRTFCLIGGASEHFTGYRSWQKKGPISTFILDGQKLDALPPNFYTTDTFTDYALRFIEAADPAKPWFGYLAYTAPHWPIQAHPADIAKYADTYQDGPEAIRERRFARQKELGLIPASASLPELDPTVTEEAKQHKKAQMEVWMRTYAAMIDRVDQNLARVVDLLRQRGQLDNTLILFLSDNGADEVRGPLWGSVSNTPFRKFKVWVHDGGIASPLIAHWPAGIPQSQRGKIIGGYGHITDIHPTCLAAAHVQQPAAFNGKAVPPPEGISLLPALRGPDSLLADRILCWERMGNEAVRSGDWKLVRGYGKAGANGDIATDGPRTGAWELYDTATDPGETRDLAASEPARIKEMRGAFDAWATRVGVVPREDIVAKLKPESAQ